MARYVVGIDLGTTNSALAYAPLPDSGSDAPLKFEVLPIPQVVAAKEVAPRSVLPSFLYLAGPKEFPPGSLDLPWSNVADRVVGSFARDQGAKVPGRLVASAKSWLSHAGVDRRSPLLPWGAPDGETKISPVEASAAYLMHLRDAWNSTLGSKPADRLDKQEVILTVPASFDAAARDLTIEATKLAGLDNVTLLEEPQAALYAWLEREGDAWRKRVKVGDMILVCDVGGGTTDFSLIGVADQGGDLALTRLAVGEHILLGGDNMDLALAYSVAGTLSQGWDGLDQGQRIALNYACRAAKEALLAHPDQKSAPVTILGRGSKVVGKLITGELTREMLNITLLDGFFPSCARTDIPTRDRRVGLTEIGLPYAADPAITRHLAHFLTRQAGSLHAAGGEVNPSAVLFNGGVFQAPQLRDQVERILQHWAGRPVPLLEAPELDLSVARGAAYYAAVRAGRGVRIRGGVSRSYYIGVETSGPAVPGVKPPLKAVCVVPMGAEEGTEAEVPGAEFGLVVGEPAEFRFFGSTTRRDDRPGAVLDRWSPEELAELTPLETVLVTDVGTDSGDVVPVRLQTILTEVGTLELWCQSTQDNQRWKLEYNVRD